MSDNSYSFTPNASLSADTAPQASHRLGKLVVVLLFIPTLFLVVKILPAWLSAADATTPAEKVSIPPSSGVVEVSLPDPITPWTKVNHAGKQPSEKSAKVVHSSQSQKRQAQVKLQNGSGLQKRQAAGTRSKQVGQPPVHHGASATKDPIFNPLRDGGMSVEFWEGSKTVAYPGRSYPPAGGSYRR